MPFRRNDYTVNKESNSLDLLNIHDDDNDDDDGH